MSFHGWRNRQTWCLYLWFTNEYATYTGVMAVVRDKPPLEAARALEFWTVNVLWNYWQSAGDEGYAIYEDVGTLEDVDWADLAATLQKE